MLISQCRVSTQQQSAGTSMADINTTHPTDEVASTTEATSDIADPVVEAEASTDKAEFAEGEELLGEELTEELIIEDFTIDGICGVY
jgi:mycofactocin precursor